LDWIIPTFSVDKHSVGRTSSDQVVQAMWRPESEQARQGPSYSGPGQKNTSKFCNGV